MKIVKVQFGCGDRPLHGWINHDILIDNVDVRKRLPYNDCTVSFIYAEHLLEHLTNIELLKFLDECMRILVPGGAVRFSVPAIDRIKELGAGFEASMNLLIVSGVKDRRDSLAAVMTQWEHKTIFTRETLKLVLWARGFDQIKQFEYQQYGHLEFNGCDNHCSNHWIDSLIPNCSKELEKQSAIFEAIRPIGFKPPKKIDELETAHFEIKQ